MPGCAELEDFVEYLEGTLEDWKCAFYLEKHAHELVTEELKVLEHELIHELQLCIDSESDLLTCMQTLKILGNENEALKQSLKDLTAVAEPVVDLFNPRVTGAEVWPLVERLRDTPGNLIAYVQMLARSILNQVLSFMKSFYSKADLGVVADGVATDCSDEKVQKLVGKNKVLRRQKKINILTP